MTSAIDVTTPPVEELELPAAVGVRRGSPKYDAGDSEAGPAICPADASRPLDVAPLTLEQQVPVRPSPPPLAGSTAGDGSGATPVGRSLGTDGLKTVDST